MLFARCQLSSCGLTAQELKLSTRIIIILYSLSDAIHYIQTSESVPQLERIGFMWMIHLNDPANSIFIALVFRRETHIPVKVSKLGYFYGDFNDWPIDHWTFLLTLTHYYIIVISSIIIILFAQLLYVPVLLANNLLTLVTVMTLLPLTTASDCQWDQ